MVPDERIARSILVLRGRKVLLDADLADLYSVETRVLVQAVKRNPDRFPADFTFQLSSEEFSRLRSQTVISKQWAKFGVVFDAIRQLMAPPAGRRRRVGFQSNE
jgi:hypothetical protein